MKQQLATTLYPETIKKLKFLAAEYSISINTVLEVILDTYESDDISGRFSTYLDLYKITKKEKLEK